MGRQHVEDRHDEGRREAVVRLADGNLSRAWIRSAVASDQLDPGVRRLINPHTYHVSLTTRMKQLQRDTVARARASTGV